MMSTRLFAATGILAFLLCTSGASAQGAWSYEPSPSSTYTTSPVEQYPPPPSAKQQASHRGYIGSFSLGVPIWLKVDSSVVRPGADLTGFGGFDMGYVAFGLSLGAAWTPINFYNIPNLPAGSSYD
ncbi:MAG: hypothetical protein WBN29_09450, partial [Polyangiales bacterium]